MLVDWTKNGAKVIQVPSSKAFVVLRPGYNQVDDASWAECRNLVLCQIADEAIIEEWQDVEKGGKQDIPNAVFSIRHEDNKLAATTVHVPIMFKEISRKRIDKIIEETFDVKTLAQWKKDDTREDIMGKLATRISDLEAGKVKDTRRKK